MKGPVPPTHQDAVLDRGGCIFLRNRALGTSDERAALQGNDAYPSSLCGGATGLAQLIQLCWHDDPIRRPTFSQVAAGLKEAREGGGGWREGSTQGRDGEVEGDWRGLQFPSERRGLEGDGG
ncbi:hypothetical protein NSK_006144 [Nannochloropsis salina CCMP1776]|uniref:Serine-threonine/tyrosine-protein kinase catalytic domain-containing protein n=1 Tax=Nannochloropsis salina CCMP1776 TaxID=1027361 RepID=A0A4D9CTM4_9STRA|nr:hypothetical protein NSK_006144 [Nannochloropsis salina CCMP1776]|eukprot:TFJ82542.1 hypothetical protein NSK_006144 [Nannochloropsis salina CCMP1776]